MKNKKKNEISIRNSTAEFLILSYQSGGGGVDVRVQNGTIWLSQKNMGLLFDTSTDNVGLHLKNIFKEEELQMNSVTEEYSVTAADGKNYRVKHYNLDAIIAVGYRVNSKRADATKERMGLTNWANSPDGRIVKHDVSIAKNYLTESELQSLSMLVNAYLDLAERRAKSRTPMTMEDWAKHLDLILQADGNELLTNAGKISAEIAKDHAESEFEKYRIVQDRIFESDFDRFLELEEAVSDYVG